MTLTSRFTNAGLDLLADWAAHPEHARPFSIMKLGTLTDAEYETKEYDGSETDITHTGSDDPVAELVVTTVKVTSTGGLAGSAVAKVTGALRPNVAGEGRELRGHHIREKSPESSRRRRMQVSCPERRFMTSWLTVWRASLPTSASL